MPAPLRRPLVDCARLPHVLGVHAVRVRLGGAGAQVAVSPDGGGPLLAGLAGLRPVQGEGHAFPGEGDARGLKRERLARSFFRRGWR